ncbi:MAG: DUF3841 domain-containing protein [Propionicimonas sp.]|uniref:DUF3841 domain-containing protein n=1 Tax=Propionicimonas sp. TaxID=1955623 RepID=UPI003D0EB053
MASTITLWSLQDLEVWDVLRAGGVYRTDRQIVEAAQIADHSAEYGVAYNWLAGQLAARTAPPVPGMWPVWAWHTCDPARPNRRPDLRRMRPDVPGVMLELQVPAEQVLLSDLNHWHVPLNGWYDGRDWRRFEREVDARGIRFGDWDAAPDLKARVVGSWQACLRVRPDVWPVQAVLWEIRPEHVRNHWRFNGRPDRWTVPTRQAGEMEGVPR